MTDMEDLKEKFIQAGQQGQKIKENFIKAAEDRALAHKKMMEKVMRPATAMEESR